MIAKTVTIEGLPISYFDSQTEGPCVVMIHGNSASKKVYLKQFAGCLPTRNRLIALDLPGHGDSGKSDNPFQTYRPGILVQIVVSFLKEIGGDDGVLVGNSLGGHLLLQSYTCLPKVKGMVVFGTPPLGVPPVFEEAFLPNPSISLLFKNDLSGEEMRLWKDACYSAGVAGPDFVMEDFRKADGKFRSAIGQGVAALDIADERKAVENLSFPLAVLHGEYEKIANMEYLRTLPTKKLWRNDIQLIKSASHTPQWEHPEAFDALLQQYIDDITGS